MTDPAITAAAGYAPRSRLPAETVREAWGRFEASGIEAVAVPAADEDALTMGVEAAERALAAADTAPDDLRSVALATTTPPTEAEDLTARLGDALGVTATADRTYHTGSARGGVAALRAGFDAALPALVVAADCPRGEPASAEGHAAGAGAAAFVVAAGDGLHLRDAATYAADAPGTRFREPGDRDVQGLGVTGYDRATYREVVTGAVAELARDTEAADAVALGAHAGDLPYRVAGDLGVEREALDRAATLYDLGDTGAACAPLGLVRALASGAESVLVVGYGAGAGADALWIEGGGETGDGAPSVRPFDADGEAVSYAEALRLRGEITPGPAAGGAAEVSVPAWRRSREARYRLVAGRCRDCGELAFPPEGACPHCASLAGYEDVRLPREGPVETATTVSPGGAPPEFRETADRGGDLPVAVVAFADPAGDAAPVSVPMGGADAAGAELAHGTRVRSVFRRIDTAEGVPRYGRKALPVE